MIDLTKLQDRTLEVRLFCTERGGWLSRIFKKKKKKVVEINVLPPTVGMRKELAKMTSIKDISDAYAILSKMLSHNKECQKITTGDLSELDIDDITNITHGYIDWINKTKTEKN